MDIVKGVKTMWKKVKKVKRDIVNDEKENEDYELLERWKPVFEADKRAKAPWDKRFDQWESIYDAGRDFQNMEDEGNNANKKARTIINFPRMIIESLIALDVPDPDFKAVSGDDEDIIEALKHYVMYVVPFGSTIPRRNEPP